MKYLIQFILLVSNYSCFAWSDCDPITYKDTNYYHTRYREDSIIMYVECHTDSFYYYAIYHRNGKIARETWSIYNVEYMKVNNSWDTLGNPLVVNGNGYHYEYHDNGNIKWEGFYKNYLRDGIWKYYSKNGGLELVSKNKIIKDASIEIAFISYYKNKKKHEEYLFNENGKGGISKIYDRQNENLIAIGIIPNDSIMRNIDSLNKLFYKMGYFEVEYIDAKDCKGRPETYVISKEGNPAYQYQKVWYNDGTIRMNFEYDTLEKVLKYYEFHSNARLKTTGNVRYFSLDDIGENCPVKIKEEKNSHTKQLYGYLKCDIWKEYDELGNVCSETNMNNEFSEERKIFFDDVDTDE